jgi:hypothetical protein
LLQKTNLSNDGVDYSPLGVAERLPLIRFVGIEVRFGGEGVGDLLRDRVMREHRYDALTWPEVNEAVALNKAVLLPVGATEQHGHHLPLATDTNQVTTICLEAGRRSPDNILVLPAVSYGYTHHVMDFPGTINIEPGTFVRFLVDIGCSVAYHGFKRNYHGERAWFQPAAG